MGDEPNLMKPASPEQAVFAEALARTTPEARAAYLDDACGTDTPLRRRVEALLLAAESAKDFLEKPPTGLVAGAGSTMVVTFPSEKPGDRIGRYKLLQQIGEGGCGVVYMAEQEEPVRRRVALKVIKLGMDTKSVIARFEAERQALAMMDHPNIAKVLDAGATDTGRPYFVMELVRGIKITDYCDENNLSTEERLKLFTQVCQAIQHAHQKGIIHRDIKPSNILVTISEPGSPGCPKVIDFGIAKATTGQRLTDLTVFTAFEQFIGTPAYMSPEQAMMTSLDIDTRTDIYALGVLLYELLTGRTPFDATELMAAGLDSMRRIIREQEPARPSTRLSTLLAAELTTVAKHRHAEPARLGTLLRGDLDWIVMKALEKDRTRRYETANGLAADIQRHLKNEPVVARPPGNVYRMQKLMRRNKLAFAAASAVTIALVIGLGISTWLFFKARGEKEKAQIEAAKATAISGFLQQVLNSANPDSLKGSEYTVRQLLDDFSAGLDNQLANQPEVEAALRTTIGKAYRRFGGADQGLTHHERALELRRQIFGNQSKPVAESLVECAWTFHEKGQQAKGEPYAREALDIYRNLGTTGQPMIYALWAAEVNLSVLGKFSEVEALAREAERIAAKSAGVEFPELAYILHGMAGNKNRQSLFAEAASLAEKALEVKRRLLPPQHPQIAWGLLHLGVALKGQQKMAEAEAVLREALAIFSQNYPPNHLCLNMVLSDLQAVLTPQGRLAEVVPLLRDNLAARRKLLGNEHLEVATSLCRLSFLLREEGQLSESESTAREALAIRKKLLGDDHVEVAQALHLLAWNLNLQGKHTEAESLSREELAMWRKLLGKEHPNVGWALWDLTVFLHDQGKLAEAEATIRESLAIRQKAFGNEHHAVIASSNLLSRVLRAQSKPTEATVKKP